LLFNGLDSEPAFLWIGVAFIFGRGIGPFLNVVIYRLPEMMRRSWLHECIEFLQEQGLTLDPKQLPANEEPFSLALPASRCPSCGHQIRPWENIPVLSYLVLGGKCSQCKTHIAWRYPAIELLTGLLSAIVIWQLGLTPGSLLILLATWTLLALSFIDIDHLLLPDSITLPLLWLGLLANSIGTFVPLVDAVWGAMAGYLVLWSVYWGFKLLTGKEGMGYGDFKLLAAFGAWMGWQALPVIILLSALSGIVVTVSQMIIAGRSRHQPIPFGPYLAIAGWIALLWRDDIVRSYLGITGF
jgi:leader peptidase (prepilin peptidase)/N-methyltransferase